MWWTGAVLSWQTDFWATKRSFERVMLDDPSWWVVSAKWWFPWCEFDQHSPFFAASTFNFPRTGHEQRWEHLGKIRNRQGFKQRWFGSSPDNNPLFAYVKTAMAIVILKAEVSQILMYKLPNLSHDPWPWLAMFQIVFFVTFGRLIKQTHPGFKQINSSNGIS